MKRHLLLAVAAACAVMAHGPVSAAVSSSASIGNFGWSLIDLDSQDNVTPWITFSDAAYSHVQVGDLRYQYDYGTDYPYYGADLTSAVESQIGSSAFAATNAQALITDSSATARTTSNSATATGSTNGTRGNYYDYGHYYSQASMGASSFTISAKTIVIFNLDATVSGSASTAYNGSNYQSEQANADVAIQIYGAQQSSNDSMNGHASSQSNYDPERQIYLPSEFNLSGPLSVSFSNLSTADKTGNISVTAYVSGTSSVAAVPEPETYALMLAGLGVISFFGRRRQEPKKTRSESVT